MNLNITSPITVHSLPDELLLAIFVHLPSEELVLSIPLVCQRWSDLHRDASLYKHLEFKANGPTTSVAVKLLKMAPGLKSLEMESRCDSDEILRHVPTCNPLLETFKVIKCRGSLRNRDVSSICLHSVVEYCSKLKILSLRKTVCKSPKFYNEIGHHLPFLQAVHFGSSMYCSKVELCNNADNFRGLSELSIFTNLSDDVVKRFCVKHSSFLNSITLRFFKCTDASLTALSTCQQLRQLYLKDAKEVTDMGILEISKLSNLEDLRISFAGAVTSTGWVTFFQTENMKRIQELSLKGCVNVIYDVIIIIAQNLSDIQSLTLQLCKKIRFEYHLNIHKMLPQHCHYNPYV